MTPSLSQPSRAAEVSRYITEHAGVYLNLDGGGVLHMDDQHGVVFDSLFELPRIRTWAYPLLFVPKS
jgi:hypothetical protein